MAEQNNNIILKELKIVVEIQVLKHKVKKEYWIKCQGETMTKLKVKSQNDTKSCLCKNLFLIQTIRAPRKVCREWRLGKEEEKEDNLLLLIYSTTPTTCFLVINWKVICHVPILNEEMKGFIFTKVIQVAQFVILEQK